MTVSETLGIILQVFNNMDYLGVS